MDTSLPVLCAGCCGVCDAADDDSGTAGDGIMEYALETLVMEGCTAVLKFVACVCAKFCAWALCMRFAAWAEFCKTRSTIGCSSDVTS